MNELILLKKEIEALKQEIQMLKQASTLPYEVIRSFQSRGFVYGSDPIKEIDPNFNYTTNEGFRRDISLTGESQTITVPAYPLKYIKLKDQNLYLGLYAYADI